MDLQNTTYFDKGARTGDLRDFENASLFSPAAMAIELTTLITTLNDTNRSSTEVAKTEDLEALLPITLVNLRNVCVYYVSFIIWLLSFPANVFIIYILTQKKNRSFSTSIYFTSLATADLIVNFRTLLFWLDRSKLVTHVSSFDCKLAKGLPLVGMIASSWTLVFISIERMLGVCLMHKVKHLCRTSVAKICVTGVWILAITIGSIQAWFHEFSGSRCRIKRKHLEFFIDNVIYIYFTLDIVVPFFVILFNSIMIVSRLAIIKASSSASSKAFGTSVTVLVLVVNLIFFITQFPYGVIFVVQQTNIQYAPKLRMEFLNYLENIFLVLKYVNNGINFYLYFLAASRFRQEAKEVMLPCARCVSSIWKRREQESGNLGSVSTQLQSI